SFTHILVMRSFPFSSSLSSRRSKVQSGHRVSLHSSASCGVGTIAGDAASRRHHNTRAVKHPTRTAQLRPAGAAGSKEQSRPFRPAVPMTLGVALARLGGRCAMQPHCNACR
ncbi:hypothetical protein TcCL_Unassigned00672, partial [Trypanosoma cruzi]